VRSDLPRGTVTFLFTDIEGSTKLLHELGDAYAETLAEHRRVLREAFAAYGGVEVDTQGDAFFYAFERASDAVEAADGALQKLAGGPIAVRVGVHTGEPTVTDEGYVGLDLHRAARIAAAAHGGQIVVSAATRALLADEHLVVRDLGLHRLKDLGRAQHLYQLGDAEFPPLETLYRTNLPVQPTALVGRERELAEILALLRDHRLVTLTGTAGTGKTRLAIHAAAEVAERFSDGVWFVSLGAIDDPRGVLDQIGRVLNVGRLPDALRGMRALLVLDNLEHLLEIAPDLAGLLAVARDVVVLATSRERLAVAGEQEYPVPPLPLDDAADLFGQRARALRPDFVADDQVVALVRRLDGLPLAVELAAARTKVLSPGQILARLGGPVDVLTSVARDAADRHRSLRATLDWSYELLAPGEQRLFRALAVFAGSFTLEAAEAVCGATVDALQSLLDKSLVVSARGRRFCLLETVQQYAAERAPEDAELRLRHASHYANVLRWAATAEPERQRRRETLVDDLPNVRAAIESALAAGEAELAFSLITMSWLVPASPREIERWVAAALALPDTGLSAYRSGVVERGARIALELGDAARASDLYRALVEERQKLSDRGELDRALQGLAHANVDLGRYAAARSIWEELRSVFADAGEARSLAIADANLAEIAGWEGRHEPAKARLEASVLSVRELGEPLLLAAHLIALGNLELGSGAPDAARRRYVEGLRIARSTPVGDALVAHCLAGLAAVAASGGGREVASQIWGAAEALWDELESGLRHPERELYAAAVRPVDDDAYRRGRRLSLEEAADVALSLD
jgi:predicted ATPase/class 3 adenylate cyclase